MFLCCSSIALIVSLIDNGFADAVVTAESHQSQVCDGVDSGTCKIEHTSGEGIENISSTKTVTEASTALEKVRQQQKDVMQQVKNDSFNMTLLWELCDLKLRESRLLEGSPQATRASGKASECLQTFVSTVQMTQTLARSSAKQNAGSEEKVGTADVADEEDEDDVHELPFWKYFQFASVASQRLLMLSDGATRKFEVGVKFLADVLKNSTYCQNASVQHALAPHVSFLNSRACASGYADFLLMQKLVYGSDPSPGEKTKLTKHWESSQTILHPFPWVSEYRLHVQLPGIRAKAFWECHDLPDYTCTWLQQLESNTAVIQGELDAFLAAPGPPAQRGMDVSSVNNHIAWRIFGCKPTQETIDWPRWASLGLFVNGKWDEKLCGTEFRNTCSLLQNRPELDASRFHFAWDGSGAHLVANVSKPILMVHIYRLSPGVRLRPHFGTHGRLVISLGLLGTKADTDKGEQDGSAGSRACIGSQCSALLRVGGEERRWQHGRAQVFDDAFEHEVEHPCGAGPRFVLAASILHPDVTASE